MDFNLNKGENEKTKLTYNLVVFSGCLYITRYIIFDIVCDIMFGPLKLKEMIDSEVEKFRNVGATSPETAMTIEELGLSVQFKTFLRRFPRNFGVFVKVGNKYYLSEEQLQKVQEHFSSNPLARLLQHTASVPKGLLRVYVFKLLKEKPMSGSEITEEVEKQTGGQWKPSPGSIYPLLTWLRKNGYAEELPREATGMKRYMLTEKGNKFFDEHSNFKDKLQQKMAPMGPLFLRMGLQANGLTELHEPTKRFFSALFDLRDHFFH